MSIIVSPDYLSPISPISPISQIKITPYSTQITTTTYPSIYTQPYVAYVDVDTGLNSSWIVQKDTTKYLWRRILDKYLYKEDMSNLLKYLKVSNRNVSYVSSQEEANTNKISEDTIEIVEDKIDFIEKNLLTLKDMKKLLTRIIDEAYYKWYDLPNNEKFVVKVVTKYLKDKLRDKIGTPAY